MAFNPEQARHKDGTFAEMNAHATPTPARGAAKPRRASKIRIGQPRGENPRLYYGNGRAKSVELDDRDMYDFADAILSHDNTIPATGEYGAFSYHSDGDSVQLEANGERFTVPQEAFNTFAQQTASKYADEWTENNPDKATAEQKASIAKKRERLDAKQRQTTRKQENAQREEQERQARISQAHANRNEPYREIHDGETTVDYLRARLPEASSVYTMDPEDNIDFDGNPYRTPATVITNGKRAVIARIGQNRDGGYWADVETPHVTARSYTDREGTQQYVLEGPGRNVPATTESFDTRWQAVDYVARCADNGYRLPEENR